MNVSHPSCSVIHPMTTTTETRAPFTMWSLCRCQCCASTQRTMSFPPIMVSRVVWEITAHYFLIFKKMWHSGLGLKWKKLQFGPASWKGHDFIPSMSFLSSVSGGGGEAEPQCGPAHHLSRRPHWLPGGSVATAEHLHGPSLSPVHQCRVWERQQSGSPLTFSFHSLYSHEQKNLDTFPKSSAQVHLRARILLIF